MAVDTLGYLLALLVIPANDQGYTGDDAAHTHGMHLEVIKCLRPRRLCAAAAPMGGQAQFRWIARFRRLARDYERLPDNLKGLHFLAFAILIADRFVQCMAFCL